MLITVFPVMIRILILLLVLLSSGLSFAGEWRYIIQPGDNLWDLTESFLPDISYVDKLAQHNAIRKPVRLVPGTELLIPLAWLTSYTSEASIVSVRGNVFVVKHDQQQRLPAVAGAVLQVADQLITETDSTAIVGFSDSSRVLVQENTQIVFNRLEYYPQAELLDTGLFLRQGRIETLVPANRKRPSNFEIDTVSAIAAVRGTLLRSGANSTQQYSQIEVLRGRVSVSGVTTERTIPAGYAIMVAKGSDPGEPVQLLEAPHLLNPPGLIDRYSMRFVWQPVPGALSYRAQLFDSAVPARLVVDQLLSIPALSAPQLEDGDYTLVVRGINRDGLEGLDTTQQFILNAQPEPPLPAFPAEAQQLEAAELVLRWAQLAQASAYHLQISTDQQFSDLLFDLELNEVEFRPEQFLPIAEYFWRTATRMGDETGPFSDIQTFRVIPPAPVALPVSGDDQHMVLRWQAGDPDLQYQIQVANDSKFIHIVQDQQYPEPRLEIDRPTHETLFVRMRALDSEGYLGRWSTVQSIEVEQESPWYLFLLPFLFLLLLV